MFLDGYKSYLGALLYGLGSALVALGYVDVGNWLVMGGTTLFGVGIAHKVEKKL